MSATGGGAASGVVLGIVLVLLAQQLGYIGLSDLDSAIEYIVIAGVVLGILGALIGWGLGRRYLARHPTPAGSGDAPSGGSPKP
jgi:hypothetical protein